ncbi:MAG: ATP-binding protein, partial [Actinomycetes bacterium]
MRLGADPVPQGFTALVALERCTAEDFAADPGARAMWDLLQRHGPPAPGEIVTACRFVVDRDHHQAPGSPTFALTSVFHLQHLLTRGRRAMDFIGGIDRPDDHDAVFAYIDFHRAPDAGYAVDGRTWTVYAHDWRRQDVDAWFEMLADRELGAPVQPVPAQATPPAIALSQPDFAAAVRSALRHLQRPDRLRHNPLVRSRLISASDHVDPPTGLAGVIREAVDALAADPRTGKYHRALDRTFVRPAPTQERAAEVLGLPFSTYRRHLTRGIELVVDALWDRELYGAGDPPS